jgi:hypothetical protein
MALTVKGISDGHWPIGPGLEIKLVQFTPSVSDYVQPGGWVVTDAQVGFGNGHIYGAIQLNQEYSASSAPIYTVNLPSTSYSTTNPQVSTTQFQVSAYWQSGSNASLLEEVANATDLSAYPFWLLIFGW